MMRVFAYSVLLLCLFATRVQSHPSISVLCDQEGNIYFSDLTHVWKIDNAGNVSKVVVDVHTHQLRFDQKDNLFGEHVWYVGGEPEVWAHYLWKYTTQTGTYQKISDDIMKFPVDSRLVMDNEGNSYYSQKAVGFECLMQQKKDGSICRFSEHQFQDIRWIQFCDWDGTLLVSDMTTIKEIDAMGNVRIIKQGLSDNTELYSWVQDHHKLMGMWKDNRGNIYTAHFGLQKVIVTDSEGNILREIDSTESWSPTGGVFDPSGNLWILEFSVDKGNIARVKKIDQEKNIHLYYPKS